MAFSDYKSIAQVQEQYQIQYLEEDFIEYIEGWGQCLAELVAVQKINKNEKNTVFGIVTDGELWQFGKLKLNIFIKNQSSITIGDLERLFQAIGFLLAKSNPLKIAFHSEP